MTKLENKLFRSDHWIVPLELSDTGLDGRRSDRGDRREGAGADEEGEDKEERRKEGNRGKEKIKSLRIQPMPSSPNEEKI